MSERTVAATQAATAQPDIDRMLRPLLDPALADLMARLSELPGLTANERQAIGSGVAVHLREVGWRQIRRVVLVELQAARLAGRLTTEDSRGRWAEWVETLARPGGWELATEPYPDLLPRLRTLITRRCAAGHRLAARLDRDRRRLAGLLGSDPGELAKVVLGAGDSHHGGQTVAMLRLAGGRLVYKPRSVAVDAALDRFLRQVLPGPPERRPIRVPAVLPRADQDGAYGWAAYVAHQYCRDDGELEAFYRGLGHWLAVMRLLGGSDLHAENLIAAGPVPVVVDCETLLTPYQVAVADGYGAAAALAVELLGQSVLCTGLLPGRAGVGWRGADVSAAGNLPGEQPSRQVFAVLDHGTDRARMGLIEHRSPRPGANHPSPEPDLRRHWEQVVDGYTEATGRLHALDAAGALEPALAQFSDLPVRVVLRDTSVYAGLMQMLWHPSSLFEPEPAQRRAAALLARQARNQRMVPGDPAVVEAEVADLLAGDIPVFTTKPGEGVLTGPQGVRWAQPQDLVAAALRRWRDSDLATDQKVIRATLVSAYLNEATPEMVMSARSAPVRRDRLEHRRRQQAALIMRQLAAAAIRGSDGTATWVAPTYAPSQGWTVRATTLDVYNGLAGIAILLAGYQREVGAGRADPVADLAPLLAAVVRSLELAEEQQAAERADAIADGLPVRPEPPGGYLGIGAGIWTWLLLPKLGAVSADHGQRRAEVLAESLPEAVAADETDDLLAGSAGAVVPLLRLAGELGQDRWLELARTIGRRLAERAIAADAGFHWPGNGTAIPPTIGVAHGASGIGWALARLAHAAGEPAAQEVADAAYAWVDSYRDQEGWRDPRGLDNPPLGTWCHGATGIGLCAADLLAGSAGQLIGDAASRWQEVLALAARVVSPQRYSRSLILCHGNPGRWELLDRAWRLGLAPPEVDLDEVAAHLIGMVEVDGPAPGVTRDVFQPGLLVGSGGVAYQLLRMHPDCDLPSVLLPDPAPPPRPYPPTGR